MSAAGSFFSLFPLEWQVFVPTSHSIENLFLAKTQFKLTNEYHRNRVIVVFLLLFAFKPVGNIRAAINKIL